MARNGWERKVGWEGGEERDWSRMGEGREGGMWRGREKVEEGKTLKKKRIRGEGERKERSRGRT